MGGSKSRGPTSESGHSHTLVVRPPTAHVPSWHLCSAVCKRGCGPASRICKEGRGKGPERAARLDTFTVGTASPCTLPRPEASLAERASSRPSLPTPQNGTLGQKERSVLPGSPCCVCSPEPLAGAALVLSTKR